ncbi:hypothetical protein ACH4SK_36360 [Streptomyces inhibens]|uniref:hypothetical protein n=1 Tax=Streptomyces inhibens TaxID=2293571 RepID=UPI0037972DCE
MKLAIFAMLAFWALLGGLQQVGRGDRHLLVHGSAVVPLESPVQHLPGRCQHSPFHQ